MPDLSQLCDELNGLIEESLALSKRFRELEEKWERLRETIRDEVRNLENR